MPPKAKKRSSKGKERKMKRKQERAEVAAALIKVKAAYEMSDEVMAGLPAFQKYNRNGLDLGITFLRVADLPAEELSWAFDLLKANMKAIYIRGGWGWNDVKKRDELTHEAACFIIARDSSASGQPPVGFVSFRFDLDEGIEVIYCYEIQLSPEVRRKGLGKFLMQLLELIGHRTAMRKVMLTVFKENTSSNNFFRERLKYVDDETSPLISDPFNAEDYTYSVLSKPLVKPVKQARPAKQVASAVGEQADGLETRAHCRDVEEASGGGGVAEGGAREGKREVDHVKVNAAAMGLGTRGSDPLPVPTDS